MNDERLKTIRDLFSDKLDRLMKRDDFNPQSLARALDVSAGAISTWTRAKNLPSTEKMIEISNLFGVSIDSLLSINADIQPAKKTVKLEDKVVTRLQQMLDGEDTEVTLFSDISEDTRFGARLNHLLKCKSMSVSTLSERTNVPVDTIKSWINETSAPDLTQLIAVCDTLHVSMDRIAYSRSPATCIQNRGLSVKDCEMLQLIADALRKSHKKSGDSAND